MGKPRIPLLSIGESIEAGGAVGVSEYMAKLSIFRVLLRHPKVAKQVHDLLIALLLDSKVGAHLRELLIMRVGGMTGSVYEWTQHCKVALDLGVPADGKAP
ncbi:MAG: carboxymuconolactone decarboxylase family protein [Candidatus Binatia bacterium]|nr:carboxymuconolactone decarboxylase family protein [Candidatus Binatia bacterium]